MNKTNTTEINDKIYPILSNVKSNESVLFNKLNENKEFGEAIIYNNQVVLKYKMFGINYKLINEYFNYAHPYFPILNKEIIFERIQNKTIFPGLLLAIYASTYMYKSNPSLEMSRKYVKLAYDYTFNYINEPNIQITQAIALISNCGNL